MLLFRYSVPIGTIGLHDWPMDRAVWLCNLDLVQQLLKTRCYPLRDSAVGVSGMNFHFRFDFSIDFELLFTCLL